MLFKKNSVSYFLHLCFIGAFFMSCNSDNEVIIVEPDPSPTIYKIPVVVHILHHGEPIGEGFNLSKERIEEQIKILNEDYGRQEGTRGFNDHPDGGDAQIEFKLAKQTPEGKSTDGIVRINENKVFNPEPKWQFAYNAYFSYWDPEKYLNIWVEALPEELDIISGEGTFPESNLPGIIPRDSYAIDGVRINSVHFGISGTDIDFGRTLTHEIGHYLGLFHTFGLSCQDGDYCDDTPHSDKAVFGCSDQISCDSRPVMIGNYMGYTSDICMNIFTNDQIARMHYVLENSPRRKNLSTSEGLNNP